MPVEVFPQLTFGRCDPSARRLRLIRTATGSPLCTVTFDDTDHPPIAASRTRFIWLPMIYPRPMGNCAVNAAATRCVALLALRLFSPLSRSRACGPPTLYHPTHELSPEELSSVARERV